MKKIKLLLVILAISSSISTYAQYIGRLDTLPEAKRNEIIINIVKKKFAEKEKDPSFMEFINEPMSQYFRQQDTPTIHDLGIWEGRNKSTCKSDVIYSVPGGYEGRHIYVITYPLNEEEAKYCPNRYKFLMVVNGDNGYPIQSIYGPTKKAVAQEKIYKEQKEYYQKKHEEVKRMNEIKLMKQKQIIEQEKKKNIK